MQHPQISLTTASCRNNDNHRARIGDLHMSLIHICELNRVSLFDYRIGCDGYK